MSLVVADDETETRVDSSRKQIHFTLMQCIASFSWNHNKGQNLTTPLFLQILLQLHMVDKVKKKSGNSGRKSGSDGGGRMAHKSNLANGENYHACCSSVVSIFSLPQHWIQKKPCFFPPCGVEWRHLCIQYYLTCTMVYKQHLLFRKPCRRSGSRERRIYIFWSWRYRWNNFLMKFRVEKGFFFIQVSSTLLSRYMYNFFTKQIQDRRTSQVERKPWKRKWNLAFVLPPQTHQSRTPNVTHEAREYLILPHFLSHMLCVFCKNYYHRE